MRFIYILLTVAILGVLLVLGYLVINRSETSERPQEVGVDFLSDNQQVVTTVPEQRQDVGALFQAEKTPALKEFIDTHLNQEVFHVLPCEHNPSQFSVSLVFNFSKNERGINTIEAGEQYMKQHYSDIAPGIVAILFENQIDIADVTTLPFSLFDNNELIYRAPIVVERVSADLYHTFIGNTIIFSDSYECVAATIDDFYSGH